MKYQILILFLVFAFGNNIWAKKAPSPSYVDAFQDHYLNTKIADSDYKRYSLNSLPNSKQVENVMGFLKRVKAPLFTGQQQLKLRYTKQSPYAKHYAYQQYVQDVPVYGSFIKINVDESDAVYTSFFNTFNLKDDDILSAKNINNPEQIIETFYAQYADNIHFDKIYTCIIKVNENAKPVYAAVANITNKTQNWHHQVVISADLVMLYAKDLRMYFECKDTVAMGKIFNPDPLTTAMVPYGNPYADFNDSNRMVLDDETQELEIKVCFEDGTFKLQNEYVVIKELEAPESEIPTSTDGDFSFTRDESGFEDVNALYHISQFKEYIDEVMTSIIEEKGAGFEIEEDIKIDKLVDFAIEVDAHAANGEDNSYFDPDLAVPGLLFGEGGVDDAEDADVVVHEYGHAIAHSAAPFTNNGNERQSIDEGFGDYLAASYSRTISEFEWEKVFSWDGHNQYWTGRLAKTEKRYPSDMASSIHANGEIWSSALMELWPIIGRKELDKIVFSSLYCYSSNMSMADAAQLLVKADSVLNDGDYYYQIWSSMYKYGFLPYQAFAGNDTTICEGSTLRLGGENIKAPQLSIKWSPSEYLSSTFVFNPMATPEVSTWYYLTVTNKNTQEAFVDSIFVTVETCGSEALGLLNSENYYTNGENLFIVLPNANDINYRMDLFNTNGQEMGLYMEQFAGSTYQLAVNNLPTGIYFLRVFDEDANPHIFRFARTVRN